MYLTVKQQVKHLSKEDYCSIKELCHVAKNLMNEAIYNIRQYYFTEGEFLKYEKNYSLLKNSPNYKTLNSNMAQQILKEVDGSFKSFFGLLKLAKQGKYAFKDCKLPHYLPKDGYTTLVIGFVRLNGNELILPFSNSFKKTHKAIARDRNNKVNDYMNKAARKVIDYCISNDIGTLVVGYNETFQRKVHIGKQNNQNFVNIPYGRLQNKLQYLCDLNGIKFVKQEESYTSKASFWDKDIIPVYNNDNPKEYEFKGSRVKRGLYKTSSGKIFNADVNGALNIMRKSRVVDMNILYSRGEVDTPIRIRIA